MNMNKTQKAFATQTKQKWLLMMTKTFMAFSKIEKKKENQAKIVDFRLTLVCLSLICASGSQQRMITHFQTEPEAAAVSSSKLQYSR